MRFPDPLQEGVLVRRYKRFLADVELPGEGLVTAHCANPGSMTGLTAPGAEVWLSPARNPSRKLSWTLELVRVGKALVGVNTGLANPVAAEAIAAGVVPGLAGYGSMRREVRYGEGSRIDLLLEDDDRPPCHVEVKSVTLKRDQAIPGLAEFPDSVTARGAKHLGELSRLVAAGGRAVMLYVVQRGDCDRFSLAADIDPAYARASDEARRAGLEIFCHSCNISTEAIVLSTAVNIPDGTPAIGA